MLVNQANVKFIGNCLINEHVVGPHSMMTLTNQLVSLNELKALKF